MRLYKFKTNLFLFLVFLQISCERLNNEPIDKNDFSNHGFHRLVSSDIKEGDQFGNSVAVSENYVIVGNCLNDENGYMSGAVYVFKRNMDNDKNWSQIKKIQPSDPEKEKLFGYALATDGNWLIVGAPNNNNSSGSVYIFQKDHGGLDNWGEIKKIKSNDSSDYDRFGYSLSISNDFFVVGSPSMDNGGNDLGCAYVYCKNKENDDWVQNSKLVAFDSSWSDFFGISVCIENNDIVVGSYKDDDKGNESGSCYIFNRNESDKWDFVQKLVADDGSYMEYFGMSVSISSGFIAVGCSLDDENGENSGSVYIFTKDPSFDGKWKLGKKIMASDGKPNDLFGRSVIMNKNYILVSAKGHNINNNNIGAIYLYEKLSIFNSQNSLKMKIIPPNGFNMELFGNSISLSDQYILVGAKSDHYNGKYAGACYVYDLLNLIE